MIKPEWLVGAAAYLGLGLVSCSERGKWRRWERAEREQRDFYVTMAIMGPRRLDVHSPEVRRALGRRAS